MRKLNVTIVIGLMLALLGAGAVLAYGRSVDERIRSGRSPVRVLVANRALEAGTTAAVARSAVRLEEVPRAFAADGALASLDTVSSLVLRGPVAKGAQITQTLFGPPGAGFTVVKPSTGHVALAIDVGLTPGVAGYVAPGSAVDIFVTFPDRKQTKLFATGIAVLSVSIAAPPEQSKDGEQARTSQGLAILDVDPREAERIVNAATLGKLYLALSTTGAKHITPAAVTPEDEISANR